MLPCYIKRHRALSRVYLWPASLKSPERLSPSPIPPQMNRPDFSLQGKAACRANRSATADADKWVSPPRYIRISVCRPCHFLQSRIPSFLSSDFGPFNPFTSPRRGEMGIARARLDRNVYNAFSVKLLLSESICNSRFTVKPLNLSHHLVYIPFARSSPIVF